LILEDTNGSLGIGATVIKISTQEHTFWGDDDTRQI